MGADETKSLGDHAKVMMDRSSSIVTSASNQNISVLVGGPENGMSFG
jgi:hypothetical protein